MPRAVVLEESRVHDRHGRQIGENLKPAQVVLVKGFLIKTIVDVNHADGLATKLYGHAENRLHIEVVHARKTGESPILHRVTAQDCGG